MFKTLLDYIRLIISKFNSALPEVDPSIKPSFENVIINSCSATALSLQDGIKDAMDQMFLDTADEEFLLRHGSKDGVERLEATKAAGFVSVNGDEDQGVDVGTQLTWNGNIYEVQAYDYVHEYSGTIALSFLNGIATAVTTVAHSLASGLSVVISGATHTEYNGTFTVLVIDENTFTYEIDEPSLGNDTGTWTSAYINLSIQSVETGADKNIDSGTELSISEPGIEDTAYVGIDGITGGYDIEDIEAYRSRAKDARIATKGENPAQMIVSARKITGVKRVVIFRPVLDATNGTFGTAGYLPQQGETVIYPFFDDEDDIVPDSGELAEIKQQILDDGLWSSKNAEDALMVLAADKKHLEFEITNLLPSTTTMEASFLPAIKSFLRDNFSMKKADDAYSGIIKLDDLKTAIRNIKDSVTGEFVVDFDIDLIADITADYGEIMLVETGDITFA